MKISMKRKVLDELKTLKRRGETMFYDRYSILALFFCNFGIPLLVPYTKDFERITQF